MRKLKCKEDMRISNSGLVILQKGTKGSRHHNSKNLPLIAKVKKKKDGNCKAHYEIK